jgi:hypothetical protein
LIVTSEGADHEQLRVSATELVDAIESLRENMVSGGSAYMQHYDCADRARQLASHLRGAMALSDLHLYPSALAVTRTAFEHQVFDRLLFLARRLVQVFEGVDDVEFARIEALIAAGETRIESIERLGKPTKQKARVIRRGLPVVADGASEPGYDLSVYYAVLQQHMPLVGRPSDQEFLDDGLSTIEERVELARTQKTLYERFLRWESLKDGLLVNELADTTELLQLEVHYRFLSTFTHATQPGYTLVRATSSNEPDHAEELLRLYLVELAAAELDAFLAMAELEPPVEVTNADEIRVLVQTARRRSAHLWFPGGQPDRFDYVEEANTRAFRQFEQDGFSQRPRSTPDDIQRDEVGYYGDPMQRLMRLHWSFVEGTTRFRFQSRWPRQDAWIPR